MPEMRPSSQITVLLAEDDGSVRRLLADILKLAGYGLLLASDGTEALRVAAAHSGKIDLLLSDVVMPGMTGIELAIELKCRRPDLGILLTSAYDEGMLVLDRGWHFIRKPMAPNKLLQKVEEALDRPAEPIIGS